MFLSCHSEGPYMSPAFFSGRIAPEESAPLLLSREPQTHSSNNATHATNIRTSVAASFCHSEERSDEESLSPAKIMGLSFRSPVSERALSPARDRGPREARCWLLGVGVGTRNLPRCGIAEAPLYGQHSILNCHPERCASLGERKSKAGVP